MQEKPVIVSKFVGVNNVRPEDVGDRELQAATNMYVTNDRILRRRPGRELLYSGDVHSLFSHGATTLFRQDTRLMSYSNKTATTVASNFVSNGRTYYVGVGDRIYYSDQITSGVHAQGKTTPWGIPAPAAPIVEVVPGDLASGRYLVCATYVSPDGEESGTSPLVTATGSGFAISVTASTNANAAYMRIYVSAVDGKIPYLIGETFNGDITFRYTAASSLAQPAMTLGMAPPPGGAHMVYHNGRIFMARGKFVFYTEIHKPWLCQLMSNYLPFAGTVTMIGPTALGMWVGTDEGLYFAEGTDPEVGYKLNRRGNSGVIPGTAAMTDHVHIGLQQLMGTVWMFITKEEGVCIGSNDGVFIALKQGKYKFPKATHGVGCMFAGIDDTYQYLVGLYGAGNSVDVPIMSINGVGTTI